MAGEAVAIEVLDLPFQSADERGECQGLAWRREIRELAAIRTELALRRGAAETRDQLFALAQAHLPILKAGLPDLWQEFAAIGRAAEIGLEDLLILNHYTDLRDIPLSALPPTQVDPGGCTAVHCKLEDGPRLLGQTWDMHGTAEPFVRLLRIDTGERSMVTFTLTGCLGMTGLNDAGVGVTINNLTSTDAQVGMAWPALVRAMLACDTAVAARAQLMATRLSSGHHYMIADATGVFPMECSGTRKVELARTELETQTGERIEFDLHTNHCHDHHLQGLEKIAAVSTTHRRFDLAQAHAGRRPPSDVGRMWAMLSSHEGYPKSICSHVDDDGDGDPSASKSCGLVVMNLTEGQFFARRGCGQLPGYLELSELGKSEGGRLGHARVHPGHLWD